jgi:hypothetical protein
MQPWLRYSPFVCEQSAGWAIISVSRLLLRSYSPSESLISASFALCRVNDFYRRRLFIYSFFHAPCLIAGNHDLFTAQTPVADMMPVFWVGTLRVTGGRSSHGCYHCRSNRISRNAEGTSHRTFLTHNSESSAHRFNTISPALLPSFSVFSIPSCALLSSNH